MMFIHLHEWFMNGLWLMVHIFLHEWFMMFMVSLEIQSWLAPISPIFCNWAIRHSAIPFFALSTFREPVAYGELFCSFPYHVLLFSALVAI